MIRASKLIAIVTIALAQSQQLPAQQIIQAERAQLTAFAEKIRGMTGAVETIASPRATKSVRDAIMDSVVAILNLKDPEVAAMPRSDALSVILLASESKNADVATGALNRLAMLALEAATPTMRLNGLSLVASNKDQSKAIPMLKRIATSNSSVAADAVQILGASKGPIGLATVQQIFVENSAKNSEAREWVQSYATRFMWKR